MQIMAAREQGFSMIEVMITMMIMAVGLIGIAGVLIFSTKNASNSQWRTQAAMVADEMAERIKANSYWVAAVPPQSPVPVYAVSCTASTLPSKPSTCSSDAGGLACPDTSVARNMDQYEMCHKVVDVSAGGLPDGRLDVVLDSTNASVGAFYRVRVEWRVRQSSDADAEVFQYETLVKP
jgi:type IV pilus assembly protein PilV